MIQAPDRIQGDGFSLRALREDDVPAYVQAFEDDPDMAYQWGIDEAPDEDDVRAQIAEEPGRRAAGRSIFFVIAGPGDELLGGVSLHRFEEMHRRAEVGFWLITSARGRGIASRAVELATRWAMDELGIERMEMTTLPGNERVMRLAERIGFTREGTLRGRNFERGRRVDIVMLGVLASDWA